uniref:rolling circle replication-associated protein n=1 Tax=Acetatifactor sp. TaxID=1872090 RepID=UPI004056B487
MEQQYNCRRYQYESGEHITFYKRVITTGKENTISENCKRNTDAAERTQEAENHCVKVSCNYSKNMVYRIARSNTWHWFITLTFDRTKTDASDYDNIVKKLKVFLNHLQQRKCTNLKYLIVAELHTDKKHYHFHGLLANCDELRFRFSGKTDKKSGLPIYNILDWSHGFTTATRVQDTAKVSGYITKYITKEVDTHLKNKHRYYKSDSCDIAEEEHFLLNEEDFLKVYADRIVYAKTVEIPQANQQMTYYELKY